MPKFSVCLAVYAEKYIEVEADTKDEAMEIAQASEQNSFSLCNYCSQEMELADVFGEAIAVEEEPG